MTTAEKWREVAQRVVGGSFFAGAVSEVFGVNANTLLGEYFGEGGWRADDDADYDTYYVILCEFLALEAEDDLWLAVAVTADVTPEPVTMVAEEEPIVVTVDYPWMLHTGAIVWTDPETERRKAWNTRIADGLRKWADWMEARF